MAFEVETPDELYKLQVIVGGRRDDGYDALAALGATDTKFVLRQTTS